MLIKEYKLRNGNGGETDIRELEDSHLKNIINYLGNEIIKCNRELSYRGMRNNHKSSMSSEQRRMIADSLHYTFNYDALQLAHTPDPKLYDVWKREIEKVEI